MARRAWARHDRAALGPRTRVLTIKRLARARELDLERVDELPPRPRVRADCAASSRPCPWFGCRYHLLLEVTDVGSVAIDARVLRVCDGQVDLDVDAMEELATCALDVAGAGDMTLDEIGDLFNLTRERVRQIEAVALIQMRREVNDGGDGATR